MKKADKNWDKIEKRKNYFYYLFLIELFGRF